MGQAIAEVASDSLPRVAIVLHESYAGKAATWDELAQELGIGLQSGNTKYLFWSVECPATPESR
jgi:hypothetical protein